MKPIERNALIAEYYAAELPDDLLRQKYGLTQFDFDEIVRVGTGSFLDPQPLKRKTDRNVRGVANAGEVARLAKEGELMPDDMTLSPLEQAELLTPVQRMKSYALNSAELTFANLVLRGLDTTAAACAAFELYDKFEAQRKASATLRDQRVAAYIKELKGQNLYAPQRGKQYLEAVLWQVVDRSMELQQVYDLFGNMVPGRCAFNGKLVVQAAVALMKLRGWGADDEKNGQGQLSHVERLRQINLNKKQD